MMITVFLKLTFLPCASVICPSSSTWSRMLNTSGCAFSISSKRSTLYGLRRIRSESWPPSSYPTYPGGEPMSLLTLCFSIYSDISTRIIAFSVPNIAWASAFDSSVFPTPVGPKNKKEPIGRFGSFKPTRPLRIALEIAVTASCCPTTRSWSTFSRFIKRFASPSSSERTGIFVQVETTSAISCSVTCKRVFSFSCSHFSIRRLICACFLSCFFLISPAFSNASSWIALSFSWFKLSISFLSFDTASGATNAANRTLEAASSTRSIALSGKKRSLM